MESCPKVTFNKGLFFLFRGYSQTNEIISHNQKNDN